VNANEVLWAIRLYKIKSAVLREVTVPDHFENARLNLWNMQSPLYGDYYRKRHEENPGKWPVADCLPEGWSPHKRKFQRRIDALIIDSQRTAVEIKVTRADFKSETEEKRAPWVYYTHKFVYAVPTGLILPDEVPDYAGIWYVDPDVPKRDWYRHGVTVAKKAKLNKSAVDLPGHLTKSLLGRLSRYEYENEKSHG
jgi:hypothetical protein